jgi:hypothetical protein
MRSDMLIASLIITLIIMHLLTNAAKRAITPTLTKVTALTLVMKKRFGSGVGRGKLESVMADL